MKRRGHATRPKSWFEPPAWAGIARVGIALAVAFGGLSACKRKPAGTETSRPSPDTATVVTQPAEAVPNADASADFDFLDALGNCEIEHDGVLLDLGTPDSDAFRGFSGGPFVDERIERDGATFLRLASRSIAYDFWLSEPLESTSVNLRLHPAAARWLRVNIDDKRVGTLRLSGTDTRISNVSAPSLVLGRGHHRLTLVVWGAPRGSREPQLELDWVRIGEPISTPLAYAAPTLQDIRSDVVLDGAPKQALVLRPTSTVRCWVRPSPEAQLRVSLGFWGAGKGVAELRVVSGSDAPQVLQSRKVSGGDGGSWTPVSIDLKPHSGKIVGIEFHAESGTRGGRVAFGEPILTRRAQPWRAVRRARVALVVVASSVDCRRIPPWGPTERLSALGELARSGVAFSAYRVPSSVPAAVVASLLTGLPPRAHGLETVSDRLSPGGVPLASEMLKQASGRAAMFTGVPTSSAAFGFAAGWDNFESVSPVLDLPASEPFSRALHWLSRELDDERAAPSLLVIHARGFHPPWDLDREETQRLNPEEYGGVLDARRGGIVLGALRARTRSRARLQDDDWVRLHALEDAALTKQDAALAQIFALLKSKNAWDSALVIFTGDVAAGVAPDLPFEPDGALSEDRLMVPLLVKFPGGELAGKEVTLPVETADITATLLAALGLKLPASVTGHDLFSRAEGELPVIDEPQIATHGDHYSTRLGPWLLRGVLGRPPALCALGMDPACANNAFDEHAAVARALWLETYRAEQTARAATPKRAARDEAKLDAETSAALTVWGDLR